MSDKPSSGGPTPARPHRDGQMFLALFAICILLIGGLAAISSGSPSAAQQESVSLRTPVITVEEGCANFARFWTVDSGLNVPIEAIEDLTNCRLSNAGTWFVPEGADDPLLTDRSVLTSDEQTRVESLRALLMADLRALDQALPNTLLETLEANYAADNLPVFGHTKRGRTDFGVKHARYQRITQAFLLSPRRYLLADYIGWLMERRSTAVAQFEASCSTDQDRQFLLRACKGMRSEFGVSSIPIIWELTDPVLIEEYLAWSVRSGEPLPTAPPTATIE